jgi:hypothetical protein
MALPFRQDQSSNKIMSLLTYLQFSVIKWAKQRPGHDQSAHLGEENLNEK